MVKLVVFILLTIPVLTISLKSMKNRKSHGFYRFFSFVAILLLLVFKIGYWFKNPFSFNQIVSWIFLLVSIYLVFAGIIALKRKGKQKNNREQSDLYAFEKTSELVNTGIFRYIRHPMYSSLLFLTWGIYLKSPDPYFLFAAIISSVFLYLTALADEKECIGFFGQKYTEYMGTTKRFIPFLF